MEYKRKFKQKALKGKQYFFQEFKGFYKIQPPFKKLYKIAKEIHMYVCIYIRGVIKNNFYFQIS